MSCVPRSPLHVYQLCPVLSAPNIMICVPRLVRNCIERYGCTKRPTIGRFLHSFIVLYFIHNYMLTYRIVEWFRQHSCYIVLRSNVYNLLKKSFRGRRQAHYVLNIAHFKLLLWSDGNPVSGRSFNAVSLTVPRIWPPNCAYIILIYSAESPVWYFINIWLFHIQKLFNWFSKYVW